MKKCTVKGKDLYKKLLPVVKIFIIIIGVNVMKEEVIMEFDMSIEELEGLIKSLPQILQELEEYVLQQDSFN